MVVQSGTGARQEETRGPVPRFRVVLADDNTDFIDHTMELLAKKCAMECDVVGIAVNGLSAVELVERLAPDVVTLDITMPCLDGLEVARRLRADGSQTRILFLTVHEDADFLREALAVGAMGYVVKSQVVSDLPRALRNLAAGHRFVSSTPRLRASAEEESKGPDSGGGLTTHG
ncbi:MAG: response regulator transcription factor [Nitrospira sp.]|nr:response regulator transcription factor [Nitrospira sp.]